MEARVVILPNNLPIADKRLDCLKRKINREPELAVNYIEKGYGT